MKIIRVILFLLILGLVGALVWAFRTNEIRSSAGPRATYISDTYKVSFDYPADWQPAKDGTAHYQGESGFFEISAGGATGKLSLDEVVGGQSAVKKNPYGSSPFIEPVEAGGQDARLILPSEDADPSFKGQSALIVGYPEPVVVDGKAYAYLIVLSDQYHIRGIAKSLKFAK